MVAGHSIIIDDQIVCGLSADGERVKTIKGKLFDGSVLEFDKQSDHLIATSP
jgi:hypothetical protein